MLDFDVTYRLRRFRYLARYINDLREQPPPHGLGEAYRAELGEIMRRLGEPRDNLQRLLDENFRELVGAQFPIGLDELRFILTPPSDPVKRSPWKLEPLEPEGFQASDAGVVARADCVFRTHKKQIQELADRVQQKLAEALKSASTLARRALESGPALSEGARAARQRVDERYRNFEAYDSVVFPITFGRELGEGEPIGIHRISPRDTHARDDVAPPKGNKLRGAALGAFGGFLDRRWRQNDILWGRLDGAERLIGILLPAADDATKQMRDQLVDEAHRAIVWEFLRENDSAIAAPLLGKSPEECTEWRQLLREYTSRVPQEPEAELAARSATRSATVTGRVFEAIADERHWEKKPFGLLATLGQLAWGLVEVSVPRSVWRAFVLYWIKLVLAFGVVATIVGLLGGGLTILGIGVLTMLGASLAYVAIGALRRWLKGLPPLSDAVSAAVSIGASAALAVALYVVPGAASLLGGAGRSELASASAPVAWLDRALIGGLAVTLLNGLLVLLFRLKIERSEGGSGTPLLRLCVARTWVGVKYAIGEGWDPTRKQVQAYAKVAPLFVSGYAFFMAVLGLRLALGGHPWGYAVSLFGVGAGLVHLTENSAVRILSRKALPSEKERSSPATPAALPRFAARLVLLLLIVGTFVFGLRTAPSSGHVGAADAPLGAAAAPSAATR
jgi:hypothetical protein